MGRQVLILVLLIYWGVPAQGQGYLSNEAIPNLTAGITFNEILARSCCKNRVGFDYNADEITSSSDDEDEFVEIVNADTVAIDINGWQLADNNDTYTFFGLNPIPPRHGVIVFMRGANVSNFDPGTGNQVISVSGFDLDNGEDIIALSNPSGLYVAVYWGNRQPLANAFAGVTSVRVDSVQKAWNGIAGTSITRAPDYTGVWTEHAQIIGERIWSQNAEVSLRDPRASPGRSFMATALWRGDVPTSLGVSLTMSGPYPNPAHSSVTLMLATDRPLPLDLRIYDMIGREVYHRQDMLYPGEQKLEISTQEWVSGVYLVKANRQSTIFVVRR